MFKVNKSEFKALLRLKLIQVIALLLFLLAILPLVPEAAKAEGKDTGGGGGTAHDLYIAAGFRVLHFLEHTTRGQAVVLKHKLDLCRLRATLDEDLVFVYQDTNGMRDHRGSIVDAYTYAWRTHLDKAKWEQYFATKQDIYFLVLKEMLRAERTHFSKAVDISRELMPFPNELTLDYPIPTLNSSVDLGCLKQEEIKQIEEIKGSHLLFTRAEAPRCIDANLLKRPEFKQQNTADKLIDLVKNSKCQVQPSGCRIAEETEIFGETIVISNSIYWKNRQIFSVPIGAINLENGQKQKNIIDALTKKSQDKLKELEVEGVCGLTSKLSVDKIKSKTTSAVSVSFGEKLKRKEASNYQGLVVKALGLSPLNCKTEEQDGKIQNVRGVDVVIYLRSAAIIEATRLVDQGQAKVNLKLKMNRADAINHGFYDAKIDVVAVEVIGSSSSTTPKRISIQLGVDTVVPTGGWANPGYSKAMVTLKTIECQ